MHFSRSLRVPMAFAPDTRPGADGFVYCKGCGRALEGESRHLPPRTVVTVMMCDECRQRHHHQLIPTAGAPTFCYRCGRADEIFVERAHAPIVHHICPRCVPDRAARYRAGNFKPVLAQAEARVQG